MQCAGAEGPCERQDAIVFRTNTKYADDRLNIKILCPECQELSNIFWESQWREYYSEIRDGL